MPNSSWTIACRAMAVLALVTTCAWAQADVIVGDVTGVSNFTSVGGIGGFSIGTTSCHIGTIPLNWISSTNQHPVIGQTMYRLKDGRFEQIGTSWLKHGFTALAQSLCSPCQNPGTGTLLGVNCSDPYSSGLNGQQSNLGPRTEVNASTGFYPYPYTSPAFSGTIARRLQVKHADLDPALNAGAIYFAEGQYITEQDATANNDNNNASYRRIFISGGGSEFSAAFGADQTQRTKPAIYAWRDYDATVGIVDIDVPSDGRLILGTKFIPIGGGRFRVEAALQNLNSDRSVQGLTFNFGSAAVVNNAGFHDVPLHSSEPFTGATGTYNENDWTPSISSTDITFMGESFAANQKANAIRWGTTFSFWFETDVIPNNATITLFKPGMPTTVSAVPAVPQFLGEFVTTPPLTQGIAATSTVDVAYTNLGGMVDPASVKLWSALNTAPFTSTLATSLGGGMYRVTLPAGQCFDTIRWYVEAKNVGATVTVNLPAAGAASPLATNVVAPGGLTTVFFDDMEVVQPGWTVVNGVGLTDGAWDAAPAIPVGGGTRGDPATAFGGSGKCFLTDNVAGNSDVDGGETTLISPTFSLAGSTNARVSARIWHDNNFNGTNTQDSFQIRISNNNGTSWVTAVTTLASPDAWTEYSFNVAAFVTPTATMKLLFSSSDANPGQVVESGVDNVRVEACPVGPMLTAAGAGNVGIGVGGPYNQLTINGSTGGSARRVDVALGGAVSIDFATPPTSPNPVAFALFGTFGAATNSDYVLPASIGTMVFAPCDLDPLNPVLFTLTDSLNLGICAPVLPSGLTPWNFTVPAGVLVNPLELTFQAVTQDPSAPLALAVSNGVILKVQ